MDINELYDTEKIPRDTRDALDLYIQQGVYPNDRFVGSVLENKLKQSYINADERNLVAIPAIVYYLYNNAPAQAWGDAAKVKEWVDAKGMMQFI